MSYSLIYYLIVFVVVVVLFLSLLMTKKIHYFVSGLILIGFGTLIILNDLYIVDFDLSQMPILSFIAVFFIGIGIKDLFKESIKEKESKLKYPTLVFAGLVLIVTTIPILSKMEVIDFHFEIPLIINAIIYIISGIFLWIGIFTLLKTNESDS